MEEVQEAVGGVTIMPAIGEQAELPVQEDDGVARLQEVLCRGGAAGPGGKVVDEADGLLLQGHSGATGGDENDAAVGGGVVVDEVLGLSGVAGESLGRRIGAEVLVLDGGGDRLGRGGHAESAGGTAPGGEGG